MKVAMLASLVLLLQIQVAFSTAKVNSRLLQYVVTQPGADSQSAAAYYTTSTTQPQTVFTATSGQPQTVYATTDGSGQQQLILTTATGQPQQVYATTTTAQPQAVYATTTTGQPQYIQTTATSGGLTSQSPAILSSYKGNYVQGLDQVNTVFTNPALSSATGTNYYYDPTTKLLINTRGQTAAIPTGTAGKINNQPVIIPQGAGSSSTGSYTVFSGTGSTPSTVSTVNRVSQTGIAGGSMAGGPGMVTLNQAPRFVNAIPATPIQVVNNNVVAGGRVYIPGSELQIRGNNWVSGYPVTWTTSGQYYVIPVLFSGYWTAEMNDPQYWVSRGYPSSTWIQSGSNNQNSPNYRINPFATVGRVNFEAGNPTPVRPVVQPRPIPNRPGITPFPTSTTTTTTTVTPITTVTTPQIPSTTQQVIYIPVQTTPTTPTTPTTSTTSTIDWTQFVTTPTTPTTTTTTPITTTAWANYLANIDLSKLSNEQLMQLINMQPGLAASTSTSSYYQVDPSLVNAILVRIPTSIMNQLLAKYPGITSYQIGEIIAQSPSTLQEILALSVSPTYMTTNGKSSTSTTTTTITTTPIIGSTTTQFTSIPQISTGGSGNVIITGSGSGNAAGSGAGFASGSSSGSGSSSSSSTIITGVPTTTSSGSTTISGTGSLTVDQLAQLLLTPQTTLSNPTAGQTFMTTQRAGIQSANSTSSVIYPDISNLG